jgi:hypothetical protein
MRIAGLVDLAAMSIRHDSRRSQGFTDMMKNLTRAILGLILTAAATWLANRIVDQLYGPDELDVNA